MKTPSRPAAVFLCLLLLLSFFFIGLTPDTASAQTTTTYTASMGTRAGASDLHISLRGELGGKYKRVTVTAAMITSQPAGCGPPVKTMSTSGVVYEWPKACFVAGNSAMVEITYTVAAGATVTPRIVWTSTLLYEHHPALTWDDFEELEDPPEGTEPGVVAEAETGFSSETWESRDPTVMPDGDGFKATGAGYDNVETDAKFTTIGSNKGSWVDDGAKTAALLNHEQKHFDLSKVFALKLKIKYNAINETGKGTTRIKAHNNAVRKARAKRKAAFADLQKKHTAAQNRYDNQTNHGTIGAQQAAWDASIAACMAALNANIGASTWTIPPVCQNVC